MVIERLDEAQPAESLMPPQTATGRVDETANLLERQAFVPEALIERVIGLSHILHNDDHKVINAINKPKSKDQSAQVGEKWSAYVDGLLGLFTDLESTTAISVNVKDSTPRHSLSTVVKAVGVNGYTLNAHSRKLLEALNSYHPTDEGTRAVAARSLREGVKPRSVGEKKEKLRKYTDFSERFISFLALHFLICGYRGEKLANTIRSFWREASEGLLTVWKWQTILEFATEHRATPNTVKQCIDERNLTSRCMFKHTQTEWPLVLPPGVQQEVQENYRTQSGRRMGEQSGVIFQEKVPAEQSLTPKQQRRHKEDLENQYPFLDVTRGWGGEIRARLYAIVSALEKGEIDEETAIEQAKSLFRNYPKEKRLNSDDLDDLELYRDVFGKVELGDVASHFRLCQDLGEEV